MAENSSMSVSTSWNEDSHRNEPLPGAVGKEARDAAPVDLYGPTQRHLGEEFRGHNASSLPLPPSKAKKTRVRLWRLKVRFLFILIN